MPPGAVWLFLDATILRLFPPLRAAWAMRGEQAVVRITGRNAKRVLFGVINPRTGHRIVLRRPTMRQADFQAFLRRLRQPYPGRPIWLLLDRAPCHEAIRSQVLAAGLNIELIWLPKQCSELNAMDQLGKELKNKISSNRQFKTIDEHARQAENWVLDLSNRQALRKAGILSTNFWLKDFLKNFVVGSRCETTTLVPKPPPPQDHRHIQLGFLRASYGITDLAWSLYAAIGFL